MSEETTKTNNTIMTAAIVALVVGIGFFALKGATDTETDATTIVATVENDAVVEEVMVIADQGSDEDNSDTVPAVEMTEAATTADANEE